MWRGGSQNHPKLPFFLKCFDFSLLVQKGINFTTGSSFSFFSVSRVFANGVQGLLVFGPRFPRTRLERLGLKRRILPWRTLGVPRRFADFFFFFSDSKGWHSMGIVSPVSAAMFGAQSANSVAPEHQGSKRTPAKGVQHQDLSIWIPETQATVQLRGLVHVALLLATNKASKLTGSVEVVSCGRKPSTRNTRERCPRPTGFVYSLSSSSPLTELAHSNVEVRARQAAGIPIPPRTVWLFTDPAGSRLFTSGHPSRKCSQKASSAQSGAFG